MDADSTITTTVSGCSEAMMSSTMAKVLFGPEGQLASGNVPPAATSFSGSITYPSSDGTITYNAQWSFQRM